MHEKDGLVITLRHLAELRLPRFFIAGARHLIEAAESALHLDLSHVSKLHNMGRGDLVKDHSPSGLMKVFTYEQIEDFITNRCLNIECGYDTIESWPDMPNEDFNEIRQDQKQLQIDTLNIYRLIKRWHISDELHLSGVDLIQFKEKFEALFTTGISMATLTAKKDHHVFPEPPTLAPNNWDANQLNPSEDSMFRYTFSDPNSLNRFNSASPEEVLAIILDDLIEKTSQYSIDTGSAETFRNQVRYPTVAILHLVHASIKTDHHALSSYGTGEDHETLLRLLLEELRQKDLQGRSGHLQITPKAK